jgi:S1-C subfamily serine protease
MYGEVVGITAAIVNIRAGPQVGSAQNLNLAVPINSLKDALGGGSNSLVKESAAFYYSLGNLADNKQQ